MRRTIVPCVIGATLAVASRGFAQVIGNWSNDTSDGWFDWTSGNSGNAGAGANPLPSPIYSYANPLTGLDTPGLDSLLLTNSGYRQDLSVKLEYEPGGMAAFDANNAIQLNVTIPGSSTGYNQLYEIALNAPGWGFNALTADPVPGANFPDTGVQDTYTITIPYTNALAEIPANPGYAEFIITTNNGGGASNQIYFNSVSLVTVPEPASCAIGLAALGLPLLKRPRRGAK